MKKHLLIKFGIVLLLQISACDGCRKPVVNPTAFEDFDPEKLRTAIQLTLETLRKDTAHTHYYDTLAVYYKNNDYSPVWFGVIKDSMFRVNLFRLWDSIPFEGFKQNHYAVKELKERILGIGKIKEKNLYRDLALLELKLSNSMVTLWHDKLIGRSNPIDVLGAKYTLPYPSKPFQLLAVLSPDSGVIKTARYYPAQSDYWRLKKMLMERFGETEGTETFIDTVGVRKVKPGDTTAIVPLLTRRLVELGLAPDSLMTDSSFIYSKAIAKYVIEFQKVSNVTDDGIIGKATLKLLNASKNDKINEIRANMERIRWFSESPPKPYVMVNLPEFMLYMVYPDSVKSTPVCIGQGKERLFEQKLIKYSKTKRYTDKPQNHETPQVYSNIDYVILNPTWTVPSSIVGREMYGKIVKDPGYLIRNGYQVFKNNEAISPYDINWRQYSPGNIPFTIRQDAGDENSLGKIKFTFKNPFSVYLHDTPLKNKFKLNNRAVSHGCVRVQNPMDFAGFVLQQNLKLNYEEVRMKMGLSPTDSLMARAWREDTTSYKKIVKGTYPVRLENKLTVFFDYKTIVFDEFGMPRFIYDVYDKNRLIIEAMDKP
ncbi:MAG: L,D-transpeptidase family protein [Bacteroidota bacterium]